MTEEELYDMLCRMTDELRAAHRVPTAIPYTDVLMRSGMTRECLRDALNGLYVKGGIEVMDGLNEKLIFVSR